MVTIPKNQLSAVDVIAKARGESRSQFVREALIERLERLRQLEFAALLAEGYRVMADTLELAAEDAVMVLAEASEVWIWDEDA